MWEDLLAKTSTNLVQSNAGRGGQRGDREKQMYVWWLCRPCSKVFMIFLRRDGASYAIMVSANWKLSLKVRRASAGALYTWKIEGVKLWWFNEPRFIIKSMPECCLPGTVWNRMGWYRWDEGGGGGRMIVFKMNDAGVLTWLKKRTLQNPGPQDPGPQPPVDLLGQFLLFQSCTSIFG